MKSVPATRLPGWIIYFAGVCTIVAVAVSAWSIYLQLKNYRKPSLQRMVIRIMVMVPIYAISSLVSLHSLEAAFVIDAIRDIYEAFVIYCFFELLLFYLGGERSLLIMLHGRPPKEPVFPLNLFKREIDVSDPYTFLFLKRGIFQYVQLKPLLAATTLILKACGKYNEGDFRANSGYLYISIIYNVSICTSLYCLGMFWVCVNDDLKPFRPVPKFLCVKGILFFSFWQSVLISVLVAAKAVTKLGPYHDPEHVSTGINNLLICAEMPLFAVAHMFAFSYKDFIDPLHTFVARMSVYFAFRDAFGLKDVVEDGKATLRGEGMDYREFEPAEGLMHQGEGRFRRIKAGLRYSKGGKRKYWLPKARDPDPHGRGERFVNRAIAKIAGDDQAENTDHAPLLQPQEDDVVHLAPDMMDDEDLSVWDTAQVEDGYELPFGDLDEHDEELFAHSKRYLFGDYNYPCIDISSESARVTMWDEEERVLRDERGAWFSPIRGAKGQEAIQNREGPVWQGYGAVDNQPRNGRLKEAWTNKDKSEPVHQVRKAGASRVIDLESDRAAASSPSSKNAVHLKWTKGSQDPSSSKPTPRVSPQLKRAESSSSSASSGHTRLLRSPPTVLSRSNSRQSNPATSPLPPDAVDLVVEDPGAAEEQIAHERRKGEPAVRPSPGLKKVYRKGFEVGVPEGEEEEHDVKIRGQVEVEEPSSHQYRRRIDAGEKIIHNIARDGPLGDVNHDVGRRGGRGEPLPERSRSPWDDDQSNVVTATTPPLNARINAYHFDDVPGNDDNPWA